MKKTQRIFFETQQLVNTTKKGYFELEMDFFQFYSNAFTYVASLSSNCAKDFILWVMGKVDSDNNFFYSKELYQEFVNDLQKIQKPKTYARPTVDMAVAELLKTNIISRKSRGEYTVNPKLFWSDNMSSRIEKIKIIESSKKEVPEGARVVNPVFSDEELKD